ncbi:helix-turn-helix domain-containing protein, partial [Streptomyces caniferus]|uniref:helix-turn-helix domain-containing protein n=1 Tax=Streptomyces caniferus TaxID=285557 RepID=UPI0034519D66
MTDSLYSVEQVAERLGLHVRTIRNYVRDGRLPAVRIGKQYRIAHEDLEAFTGRPVTRRRSACTTCGPGERSMNGTLS